jgi:thiol-disulfide isomerase/thioredoxin
VKVRPRLLIGSLLAAVVLIVAFAIYAASSAGGDTAGKADDEITIAASTPFGRAPINTNAKVSGERLPNADVRTAAGDELQVDSLVGQPLVINFWSSTCVPCKKELPDFVAAHRELGDKVRFVGINAYASSQAETQFAADLDVDYELYYDGDGRFATALGISNQPVTLFVSADGTIVRQTGQIDLAEIRAGAEQLLG